MRQSILASNIFLSEQVPPAEEGKLAHVICRTYAVLACVLGLVMQFTISQMNRVETEREVLEQLRHLEQQQHSISKETVETINLKCHDLKYQIAALEHIDNPNERKATIEELKQSVDVYDTILRSGNETLDLVLMEKNLLGQKYKVKLSCMADGSRMSFLSGSDIYSLFGNALDNAFECVLREEECHRIITLRVMAVGQMLNIHMDNYCSQKLEFRDGLPITTKEDARFHGFGTRSMRQIAQRYGGVVCMSWEDERFNLDILIPIPTPENGSDKM